MTRRKGIGALHYTIPDKEPHAELKREYYGKTYNNAGVLALNLDYLRTVNFEIESLAWLAPAGIPTEVFFADETILNLRWKTILYPIPEEYNVKFPLEYQGPKAICHFFASQKESQILDFSFRTIVQNPRQSMHARIELLQMELEWLKKNWTAWARRSVTT
jgi:lipopolysaccharide biosynthesis glycosyltransferase